MPEGGAAISVERSARRPKLRAIALPSEHGGWGFLVEPVLLGMSVAPSLEGVQLGLAALSFFLGRQPLKIAIKDRLRGQTSRRTRWAITLLTAYGLAGFALLTALLVRSDRTFVLPLLVALPFGALQFFFDARNRGRELLPELSGAIALGSFAAAIALLAGWELGPALSLWAILLARSLPSILYVRARLRLERGKTPNPGSVWWAHLVGLLLIGLLALQGQAPWLGVLALFVLLARAVFGLSRYRRSVRTPVLGVQEIGYGLITVFLVALGFSSGI